MPFRALIITVLLSCTLATACQVDPCAEIDCLNAGACVAGECDCAEGFEGEFCEVREIDKFIRTYHQGEGKCPTGDFILNTHVIEADPLDHRAILIDDGVLDHRIRAEVDGWNFVIPQQRNSYTDTQSGLVEPMTLYGQGWLDLDAGLLIYQLDNNACRYTLFYD